MGRSENLHPGTISASAIEMNLCFLKSFESE